MDEETTDRQGSASRRACRPRVAQSEACRLLAFGALGVLLYVGHFAFIPIALALLLALVLSAPVEALYKRGVPRGLSSFIILGIALGIIGCAVGLLWRPVQYWYGDAPHTIRTVKQKFAPVARMIGRIEEISAAAGSIGSASAAHPSARIVPQPANAPVAAAVPGVVDSSLGAAISSLTVVILTLFLLTGGPPMLARMTAAFADHLNASRVLIIIEAVRGELGRFYASTALVNVGLGVVTTMAMLLWGMPTPYVWGVLAAILNFIPYAGPSTTLVIVTLVAAMSFADVPRILGVAGTYLAIAGIEGQVVQPLFVGRRLDINPLLIFLGLWLGGLFWGIAGVLLATPLLVALKVVAEHARGGRAVLEFLGPNGPSAEQGAAHAGPSEVSDGQIGPLAGDL